MNGLLIPPVSAEALSIVTMERDKDRCCFRWMVSRICWMEKFDLTLQLKVCWLARDRNNVHVTEW
jgi:hypothetical protein